MKKLQEKYKELLAAMDGMLLLAKEEERDFTEEEDVRYQSLVDATEKTIVAMEREAQLQAFKSKTPIVQQSVAEQQPLGQRIVAEPARKEFETVSEFLSAVHFNPNDQRLSNLYDDVAVGADGSMGEAKRGGFLIPKQFSMDIYRVSEQDNVIRARATVIPAGSPPDAEYTMPALNQGEGSNLFGGVEVKWLAEGGTKPATDIAFDEISWKPHEVAGKYTATDKMLRNWQASAAMIEQQLRAAVLGAEDVAFYRGSGVGKPLGILNAGATLKVNRVVANKVSYQDLINIEARIRLTQSGRYVWLLSTALVNELRNLRNPTGGATNGDGALIYTPSAQAGLPPTLLGYPVIWFERASGLGTLGDVSLVDLSQYYIKDGSGPFVLSDGGLSGSNFDTNKTSFKIFWNVDGRPPLNAPYTLENQQQVSPFVTLDIPA